MKEPGEVALLLLHDYIVYVLYLRTFWPYYIDVLAPFGVGHQVTRERF